MYIIPQFRGDLYDKEKRDNFSLIPFGNIQLSSIEEKPVTKQPISSPGGSWKRKNNLDITPKGPRAIPRIPTPEEAMWKNRNYLTLKDIHSKYDKYSKKLNIYPEDIYPFLTFCDLVYRNNYDKPIVIDHFQISDSDMKRLVWKVRYVDKERRIV